MDTGVGCAIFASALVAKQARHGAGEAAQAGPCSGLRQAAPLLALGTHLCCNTRPIYSSSQNSRSAKNYHGFCAGGARALATRATRYEVDASEYGEHWNFYLTLGAVLLLNAFARIPPRLLLPVGEGFGSVLWQPLPCKARRLWCAKQYVEVMKPQSSNVNVD